MNAGRKQFESVDEYIRSYPPTVRRKLQEIRAAIRQAASLAQEKISYQIPTFTLIGNLVHFAAYAHHIGFYPTSSGIRAFKDRLAKYRTSKGAVQFPLDRPLPVSLIKAIVRFRVKEDLKRK